MNSPARPSLSLALLLMLGLWPLGGCGPAAIAIAASSAGGDSRTITDPTVEQTLAGLQPEDAATRLRWVFKRGSGPQALFWLECRVGNDDRGRIPANWLTFERGDAQPLGDSTFVAPLSAGGDSFDVRWDHGGWLNRRELANVTVTLRFRDAGRADGRVASVPLVANNAVGREPAVVRDLTVTRDTADNESDVLVSGVWSDVADDIGRSVAKLDIEVAFTSDQNGRVWRSIETGVVPVLTPRSGPGSPSYSFTYKFNPLRTGVPFGVYADFAVRVTSREEFGEASRFGNVPPAEVRAAPVIATTATTIGRAPDVLSLSIPDPDQFGSDPRRPLLQAPLTLSIYNPSSNAVRVRFVGAYTINNTGPAFPLTFARSSEPGTSVELDLTAGEVRSHYLIWNIVADEGLGLRAQQSQPQIANVLIAAAVVSPAGIVPVVSAPRESNDSTLNTPPFVDFANRLATDVRRVASAGQSTRTQRTRDVFFSQRSPQGPQEYVIGVDQSFAPIVLPGLQPFDFRVRLSRNNGMTSIYPTDLVPGRPDCIAQFADGQFPFYYVAWNRDNAAPDVHLIEPRARLGGGDLVAGGVKGAEFNVQAEGRTLPGVVFLNRDPLTATNVAQIYLKSIVFFGLDENQVPVFRPNTTVVSRTMPTRGDGSAMPLGYQIVSGDFDGNAATTEIVVGNVGAERATAAAPGWFDLFGVEADPNGPVGTVRFAAVTPNPLPPIPAAPGVDLAIDPWTLRAWPNANQPGRPGLLLARTFRATSSGSSARFLHTFDVLEQQPAGGFAGSTWRTLHTLTDAEAAGRDLGAVFATDLDGGIGGNPTPELLAVFKKTRTGAVNDRDKVDLRLLVQRRGGWTWRVLAAGLEPSEAGNDKFLESSTQLVDLNGDDLLDLVFQEYNANGSTLDSEFAFYASALTGVAGSLTSLGSVAGSRRPAVADLDGDGYADVVSRGAVHRGAASGGYPDRIGGFLGDFEAAYQLDRVFRLGSNRGRERDLIVRDPNPSENRTGVQTVAVTWNGSRHIISPGAFTALPRPATGSVQDVRPFLPNGRIGAEDAKDLAITVGNGVVNQLHRARWNGAQFTMTAWVEVAEPVLAEMAVVRKGALPAQQLDPALNQLPEDVAVSLAGTNRIAILRADANYARRDLVAPGVVVRVTSASATDDDREDLLVLTDDAGVVRLWCLPQLADGNYGQSGDTILFLQFNDARSADLRGLAFDRGSTRLANGIALFPDVVRFVLPQSEASRVRAAMIRSTLIDPITTPLGTQALDTDGDGQIEVFCGESAGQATRTLRINRGFR